MKKLPLFILLTLHISLVGQIHRTDTHLALHGLVDVTKQDTSIKAELKYGTADNFMGKAVYEGITGIWLHPDAAAKLLNAIRLLKAEHPDLSLIIYDAARPMSVQRTMWNLVRGTEKSKYVSNPANGGGLHNYGMAVDLTLADHDGVPLDMGTDYDHFGHEAHINNEDHLLKTGKITLQALRHRLLLRKIMRQAGFTTVLYEWWHFNACLREEARRRYTIIE